MESSIKKIDAFKNASNIKGMKTNQNNEKSNIIKSITDIDTSIDEVNFNSNNKVIKTKIDSFGNKWVYSINEYGIDIVTVNGNPLDIFGEYNLSTRQYGGSQMDLSKCVSLNSDGTYIFTDKYIYNILKKYFPDASDHDYYTYLQIIEHSACLYTACINSLFKQYEGKEEEFYETFGFPMYEVNSNGYIDYNYEKLIVEYYSYVESKLNLQVKDIDVASTKVESGTSYSLALFSEFLSQYNVNVDSGGNQYLINAAYNINCFSSLLTALNPFGDLNESLKLTYLSTSNDTNAHMILSASNYNLYSVDNNKKGKFTGTGIGGHAMYVIGITDDGYLKVSSWGNEYAIDLSELPLSSDTQCAYNIIKY